MIKLTLLLGYAFISFITTSIPIDPSFCDGKEDGNYAHPTHCRGYYVCITGRTAFIVCPELLLYNAELDVCDMRENVKGPCAEFEE